MTHLDLTWTPSSAPVSVNENLHWAARRRRLEPWNVATYLLARNAIAQGWGRTGFLHKRDPKTDAITVQVVIPFREKRRRDAHNYTGTVVKAVVDGIARSGIVPDDTPEWVTVLDPILDVQPDRSKPLQATIRIRPREDQPA